MRKYQDISTNPMVFYYQSNEFPVCVAAATLPSGLLKLPRTS